MVDRIQRRGYTYAYFAYICIHTCARVCTYIHIVEGSLHERECNLTGQRSR